MQKRRLNEEDGQKLVQAWRRSGLTVSEFARRAGVGEWRVRYWCRRTDGGARGLVPVVVSVGAARGLDVKVGGARIEVRRGFDAELLREVVAALGDAPC